MTELLKKDSITFSFDHRLFRGIVSIEISEKETIFHVNYTCPATGEKRDSVIALHRCPSSGENIWESRDVQPISPELLKNLCRRIEMNPNLMSACRCTEIQNRFKTSERYEENIAESREEM